MTPDSQALYYTLSTIAQTLAAALAVTVAFVAFRLPALDQTVQRGLTILRHFGGEQDFDRLRRLLLDGEGEPAVTREFERIGRGGFSYDDQVAWAEARAAYRARPGILKLLWPALAFTVGDVVLCLLALAWVPVLVKQPVVATRVLVAAIGLAVLSLLNYVWLIARSVRQKQ